MATKLKAARKAAQAGTPSIIADGQHEGVLPRIFAAQESVGTLFLPEGDRLSRRKHWIAHTLRPAGSVAVDSGAYGAITRQGRSLLPKGITAITGNFGAGECVACLDPEGREFARGLVSYGATEVAKIKGLHSTAIEAALGYKVSDEVIHRDDLVLL
jgi:glutamate 5-kinase